MRRMLVPVVAALLVLIGALPARAEVTANDVAVAREALREVGARLEAQMTAYDAALERETSLSDRLDALVVALETRERELVLARVSARDRAASMYMSAGSEPGSTGFVSTREMVQAPARYVYLASVSETDREVVNRLESARRDFEQQRQLVDQAYADQAGLRTEMDALISTIYAELDVANDRYQSVKAQWEQQERDRIERELFLATSTTTTTTTRPRTTTTVTTSPGATTVTSVATTTSTTAPGTTTATTAPPPPVPSGTMVCPVDGATTFRDSWGEPRSGGRTHKGVDMMAARWTPLVAIETGSIYRISNDPLGGLGIYVQSDATGALWYYAHNEAIADGISTGSRVVAGQLIAYVGSSGNADYNWPHVHFAWIPKANWVYANPYPVVAPLCQ